MMIVKHKMNHPFEHHSHLYSHGDTPVKKWVTKNTLELRGKRRKIT